MNADFIFDLRSSIVDCKFVMPTIEIVCVNQTKPTNFFDFSFAVLSDDKLVSHRGLFQSDFDNLQGCIYHLGNPNMREDNEFAFFAYELINEAISDNSEEDILKFNDEFVLQIKEMSNQLLIASPVSQITFSSDWQFGTKDVQKFELISENEFWGNHDSGKLQFNALYKIEK